MGGLAARPTATESSSKLTRTLFFFLCTEIDPSDMLEAVSEASPGLRLARRPAGRLAVGDAPREEECFRADFAGDTDRPGG